MFDFLDDNQLTQFWRMMTVPQQQHYITMLTLELALLANSIITMPSDGTPEAYKAIMVEKQRRHAKLDSYLHQLKEITSEQPEALAIS